MPPREYWVACGVLTLLAVAVFWEFVVLGRVFYERDVQTFWYAQVQAVCRAVLSGAWPVWDPRTSFGEPLWAYPTQVPYPTTWLNLLFPPWYVYTFVVVLHVVFSGLGLYALARRLGVSAAGALVGAGAWMSCGPLVSVANMMNNVVGAAWIPWIVLTANIALATGRAWHAILWGTCLAAPVLAGSEAVFMGGLFAAADAIRRVSWVSPLSPENRRLVRTAVTALLFALALSAAQWLPTLELMRRSSRQDHSRDARTAWSLDVLSLAQVGMPLDLKDLPFRDRGTRSALDVQTFLPSVYLGIPLLALATAAFGPNHRRRALLFGVAALVGLGFALGRHGPVYDLVVLLIPPLRSVRFPVKAMILVAFCVCVLAAMGADAWREGGMKRALWRRSVVLPAAILTLATIAVALTLGVVPDAVGARLLVGGPELASFEAVLGERARRLAVGAGVGLLVVTLAVVRRRQASAYALGLLAVVELVRAHSGLNRSAPKELYLYRPPFLSAVEPRQESRLFWQSSSIRPGWRVPPPGMSPALATALNVRAFGAPPVTAAWGFSGSYEEDLKGIQPPFLVRLDDRLREQEGGTGFLRLLQLGAVTHVVTMDARGLGGRPPIATTETPFGEPIYLFQVPEPVPRAYIVGRSRVVDDAHALGVLLDPGFDPRREVVLTSGAAAATSAEVAGRARIVAFQPDRVDIEADLSAPGYLVLVEAFDPWWRATVDGVATPVIRANLAFRAVPVPAGHRRITFSYRPPSVVAGALVTLIGLIGAFVVGMRALTGGRRGDRLAGG